MRAGFLSRWAVKVLTQPRAAAPPECGWDPDSLAAELQPADVVLVEGDQRISQVISYLTTSLWSHAALYVGAAAALEGVARVRAASGAGGGTHLIVEALAEEGVVCSPLSKYRNQRVRICRPRELREADARAVVAYAAGQIGKEYDVDNIVDLARYFLPAGIVPASLRRDALSFGAGKATEVICSSLIGDAFASVGYPVLPYPERRERRSVASLAARVLGITPRGQRPRRPPSTLLVPRDFDLSPFFEVVKPAPSSLEGYPPDPAARKAG